ncbi:MAG: hypothetical protein KHZ58_02755 [Hungatella hathewayi]|nr:hypothetical protein [Hungatella hathewayi]
MEKKKPLRAQEEIEKEAQEYITSHTKQDFINEIKNLSKTNPLLYMIIISVLKLKELQILSQEDVDYILQQTSPYEEYLKKEYFMAKAEHDAK